jgi:hypothetical protein
MWQNRQNLPGNILKIFPHKEVGKKPIDERLSFQLESRNKKSETA